MSGDKCIVCPNCGSKDISKRCPAFDERKRKTVINFKGYYYCRNCKKINKVREMVTRKIYNSLK